MMYYRNCEKSISHDAVGEEFSPGEVGRPDHTGPGVQGLGLNLSTVLRPIAEGS